MRKTVLENLLFRLTQGLVCGAFVIGLLMWVSMPWMLDHYIRWLLNIYIRQSSYRQGLLVLTMVCGAGILWIVGELAGILLTVNRDPFVPRNVSSLRRIAVAAAALTVVFLVRSTQYLSPLSVAMALVFLTMTLCFLVLGGLYARAVQYKQENDSTI